MSQPERTNLKQALFDVFAPGYSGGIEDPIKGFLAGDALAYLRIKVDLFLDDLECDQPCVRGQSDRHYLDFGCGTGDFLYLLSTRDVHWAMFGCDASCGMLDEARKRWPQICLTDNLWHITEPNQIPPNQFDFMTATCVFHHIAPSEWKTYFMALHRGLRPRGRLYIFEHNPINPVTRIMVSRAEIDRDAVLLWPFSTVRILRQIGFKVMKLLFFLYIPPRFLKLTKFERWFSRLPFGGQYMIVAERDESIGL